MVDHREYPWHRLLIAAGNVNGVNTCLFQQLYDLYGFIDPASLFANSLGR